MQAPGSPSPTYWCCCIQQPQVLVSQMEKTSLEKQQHENPRQRKPFPTPTPQNLSTLNVLKDLPGKRNFQFSLWFNLSSLLCSQFELDPEADTIQPFLFEDNNPHLPVSGLAVLSQGLVFSHVRNCCTASCETSELGTTCFSSPIHEVLHLFCYASLETRNSYLGLHFTSLNLHCEEGNLSAAPDQPWPELCLIYCSLAFWKIQDGIKCKEGHSCLNSWVVKFTLVPRMDLE